MAAMAILRRAILLVLMTVFAASAARAQVEPPPATSPPPAAAPAAPADATTPPAAPPPAAPVTPLSPTLAPEPAPAPALELTQRSTYQPPPERPFYRRTWFWVTAGVVVATVAIILLATLGEDDQGPPRTTFGNMHAF